MSPMIGMYFSIDGAYSRLFLNQTTRLFLAVLQIVFSKALWGHLINMNWNCRTRLPASSGREIHLFVVLRLRMLKVRRPLLSLCLKGLPWAAWKRSRFQMSIRRTTTNLPSLPHNKLFLAGSIWRMNYLVSLLHLPKRGRRLLLLFVRTIIKSTNREHFLHNFSVLIICFCCLWVLLSEVVVSSDQVGGRRNPVESNRLVVACSQADPSDWSLSRRCKRMFGIC